MEKSLETPHTDMMLMWGEGEGVGLGELEGRRGRGERIGASSALLCAAVAALCCCCDSSRASDTFLSQTKVGNPTHITDQGWQRLESWPKQV